MRSSSPSLAASLARTTIKDILPRFWAHVTVTDPDNCWLWKGMRSGEGYGHIKLHGRRLTAHRLSWMIANARGGKLSAASAPMASDAELTLADCDPGGWFVCHKCDNKLCVNPRHLWLGTQGDNTIDCVNKGRHANTRKTHCVRGHPLEGPKASVYLYKGSRRCRYCMQIFKRRSYAKHRSKLPNFKQ